MPNKSNKEIEFEIISRVRDYIQNHGYNIRILAQDLGMSYQQFYQKLYNRESIDISTYVQLCKEFGVSPDYFVKDLIEGESV